MRWCSFFLDKGADVNAEDLRGYTALMAASDTGQLKAVKVLVDKGADINAEDVNGRTALFQASKYGDKQVVDFLKARGAKE